MLARLRHCLREQKAQCTEGRDEEMSSPCILATETVNKTEKTFLPGAQICGSHSCSWPHFPHNNNNKINAAVKDPIFFDTIEIHSHRFDGLSAQTEPLFSQTTGEKIHICLLWLHFDYTGLTWEKPFPGIYWVNLRLLEGDVGELLGCVY